MILKVGSKGRNVEEVQRALNKYYEKDDTFSPLTVDGIFGVITGTAVLRFQKDVGINMDGVVGPETRSYLDFQESEPNSIDPPKGYKEIIDVFGEPWIKGWREDYLTRISIPSELKHVNGFEKGYFWGNRLIEDKFKLVFATIAERPHLCEHLKTYNGCFNIRRKRGGSKWSTHSWAIAIDLNAKWNPMGHKPQMHHEIVAIFEKYGFYWGGRWKRPDGMHFQYCRGY